MIHHTVTYVAITTLHLAFVTFTMDIYGTDAAIWSQTETTTDRQDHPSGTAYQQMATTESPESFPNMASTINNQLNVSLENLVSSFQMSNYVGTCGDLLHVNDTLIPNVGELHHEVITTTWNMSLKFNRLMTTAIRFFCTGNTIVGHDVISMARKYVQNFTEFIDRINSSTPAIGEVPILDTVADLYRTSIQQVESVMEVVEHLTDMISQEDKLFEISQIILQKKNEIDTFYRYSVWETIVEKQKELVSLLQNISEGAGKMSQHTDRNPFINVIISGWISRFLYAQYWAKLVEKQTQKLVKYKTQLR